MRVLRDACLGCVFLMTFAFAFCNRRGRFSVVRQATHLKENVGYAVKEVENESLDDEENLEALETEV